MNSSIACCAIVTASSLVCQDRIFIPTYLQRRGAGAKRARDFLRNVLPFPIPSMQIDWGRTDVDKAVRMVPVLVVVFIGLLRPLDAQVSPEWSLFDNFMTKFGRQYRDEDAIVLERFRVFQVRLVG